MRIFLIFEKDNLWENYLGFDLMNILWDFDYGIIIYKNGWFVREF